MTPDDLQSFLTTGVFAFMIVFVRLGTAIMIMPGIGNAAVPANIRLYFALGFTLVVSPLLQPYIPNPLPETFTLFTMIIMEFIVGLFIGTVMRVLMAAIDTAGMIIATQSSLANAQLFNPAFASQGTVIGAFLTMAAIVLLFATDMHHIMLSGIIQSYEVFPIGKIPDTGSMSELLIKEVAWSFWVAIQMTAPFLVIVLLLYICMGVMSKLMPQVQVFMIAMPIQIYMALVMLSMTVSAMLMFWLARFNDGYQMFLGNITQ